MDRNISLKDIAGLSTERAVWQLILDLSGYCGRDGLRNVDPESILVRGDRYEIMDPAGGKSAAAFAAPEMGIERDRTEAEEIWTIGALAFYAITGVHVFEGKGGSTQTGSTRVPRISSAHAGRDLSELIHECLSYSPSLRPDKAKLRAMAEKCLFVQPVPRKRLTNHAGKKYTNSITKFWPEEMVTLIFVLILSMLPFGSHAQDFGLPGIPDEMGSLVMRCVDLRSPQNVAKVSKALDRDMSWTMMDELAIDKDGECTTKDIVDMFGLNDVGFSILKRHGGVTNAGGRFRDGRDPRYKYSMIEITVKKGASVNYRIDGREGEQVFAIVPFEENAQYSASIPQAETFTDNGICYLRLRQALKKTDSFDLTITNRSGKNMSFALINYNSRNNE